MGPPNISHGACSRPDLRSHAIRCPTILRYASNFAREIIYYIYFERKKERELMKSIWNINKRAFFHLVPLLATNVPSFIRDTRFFPTFSYIHPFFDNSFELDSQGNYIYIDFLK